MEVNIIYIFIVGTENKSLSIMYISCINIYVVHVWLSEKYFYLFDFHFKMCTFTTQIHFINQIINKHISTQQ